MHFDSVKTEDTSGCKAQPTKYKLDVAWLLAAGKPATGSTLAKIFCKTIQSG